MFYENTLEKNVRMAVKEEFGRMVPLIMQLLNNNCEVSMPHLIIQKDMCLGRRKRVIFFVYF